MSRPSLASVPRRDWNDWLDRPGWWSLGDGLSVYGELIKVDETYRGQKLLLRLWDCDACVPAHRRCFYFNGRHVQSVTFGDPAYACGRRLTEPR